MYHERELSDGGVGVVRLNMTVNAEDDRQAGKLDIPTAGGLLFDAVVLAPVPNPAHSWYQLPLHEAKTWTSVRLLSILNSVVEPLCPVSCFLTVLG
jgi:hypothetical protein